MESRAKLYIREKNSLIYPVLYSATCKKRFESNPLTTRARLQFDAAVRCCYSTLFERRRQDSNLRRRSLFDFFRKYQIPEEF